MSDAKHDSVPEEIPARKQRDGMEISTKRAVALGCGAGVFQ